MPIKGYDCSLLITDRHLQKFDKTMLIEWILEFVETMDQEITEIRLNLNTQTRTAANYYCCAWWVNRLPVSIYIVL